MGKGKKKKTPRALRGGLRKAFSQSHHGRKWKGVGSRSLWSTR